MQGEAERLSIPQLFGMCALRSGELVSPQLLVEQADKVIFPERYKSLVEMFKKTWIIGSPKQAADQIERLVILLGIDEIMINPVTGSYTADDPARAPNRERTLTLLAEQLHSKS
jgi:alkanesulfonate monooxygenase SsuD/methylene tetrahydromethanopterin reductase-like flavin-dependent oxidoreductase (luciferase family)